MSYSHKILSLYFLFEYIYFLPQDTMQVHPTQNFRKDFQKGAILVTVSTMEQAKELLDSRKLDYFLPHVNGSGVCENFFSTVRKYNVAPTPDEFGKIMKVLSILRSTSADNGTYLRDQDSENWVTNFKHLKAIEDDPEFEEIIFTLDEYEIADFAEEQGLMYHLGYVLKKTICSVSHCQRCIDLLTISGDDGQMNDLKHCLIIEKAHQAGDLTLPSELAWNVFNEANCRFMTNRDKFSQAPKGLNQFIEWLRLDLVDKCPEFPACHFELILRRFFKVRMYFWARHLDAQLQKQIKEERTKHYDSRSMTGYELNKH